MRPYKSPTSIKLQNANSPTQYCPTPPLPPSVTDKPWWQRLLDRQPNSQPNPAIDNQSTQTRKVKVSPPPTVEGSNNSGNSGNSGNSKGWTWTLVQTERNGLPHRYHLRRSPEGKLLINEELMGKPYVVITRDDYRPELPSAEPDDLLLQKYQAQRQSRPVVSAQIGPQTFVAAYTHLNGQPEIPPAFIESHKLTQKRDQSWCFLPRNYGSVPESWYTPYDDFADKPATAHGQGRQELPRVLLEEDESHPTTNPSQPAHETNETEMSKEAKEASETRDPGFSDHQITRSPDHPIADEPELSPEEIMNELEESIEDYLICSPHQRTVLALWILHTYSPITSLTTPYLNIYSPVEQSGKSTCLGFLRAFSAQPWFASGVPASTLTRKIIADQPTVLLDNWHTTFRGNDKHHITGFLLNSCEHFQPFSLFEKGSVREVQVYCPKAFAGMASLPPTLAQRSIPIVLQRRLPHEKVTPVFMLLHPKASEDFRTWAQQWAKDYLPEIDGNTMNREHLKQLSALSPHQQACSQTLLGIAETLGGEWPEKARTALLEIFREEQAREASATQLLSDVYDAFATHNHTERIFTNELLDYLHSLDHRQWHEWNKGKPMTAHTLSSLLRKHFNIYSRSQRRDKQKRRGYQKADFTDAWQRYLPTPQTENAIEDEQSNSIDIDKEKTTTKTMSPASNQDEPQKPSENYGNHGNSGDSGNPSQFQPGKSRLVSMSQFKARWTKSRSILRRLAGRVVGIFAANLHINQSERLGKARKG